MATYEKAKPLAGANLNYRVVGGTSEPTNPRENTIWVNTNVAIGEHQFSYAEPTTRVDGSGLQVGDVWLHTDIDKASVSFNALTKNELMIYPYGKIRQWNGNVWKTMGGAIYQNGTATLIYSAQEDLVVNGVVYSSVYSKTSNTKVVFAGGSENGVAAGGTHSTTNGLYVSTNGYGQYVCRILNTPVDVTGLSKISINTTISMPATEQYYGGVFIFLVPNTSSAINISNGSASGFATYYRATAKSYSGTVNLDTSSLTGNYYVGVLCGVGSAFNNYSCRINNISFI